MHTARPFLRLRSILRDCRKQLIFQPKLISRATAPGRSFFSYSYFLHRQQIIDRSLHNSNKIIGKLLRRRWILLRQPRLQDCHRRMNQQLNHCLICKVIVKSTRIVISQPPFRICFHDKTTPCRINGCCKETADESSVHINWRLGLQLSPMVTRAWT